MLFFSGVGAIQWGDRGVPTIKSTPAMTTKTKTQHSSWSSVVTVKQSQSSDTQKLWQITAIQDTVRHKSNFFSKMWRIKPSVYRDSVFSKFLEGSPTAVEPKSHLDCRAMQYICTTPTRKGPQVLTVLERSPDHFNSKQLLKYTHPS